MEHSQVTCFSRNRQQFAPRLAPMTDVENAANACSAPSEQAPTPCLLFAALTCVRRTGALSRPGPLHLAFSALGVSGSVPTNEPHVHAGSREPPEYSRASRTAPKPTSAARRPAMSQSRRRRRCEPIEAGLRANKKQRGHGAERPRLLVMPLGFVHRSRGCVAIHAPRYLTRGGDCGFMADASFHCILLGCFRVASMPTGRWRLSS